MYKRWVKLANVVSGGSFIAPGTLGKAVAQEGNLVVVRVGVDHFEVPVRGIRELDDMSDFSHDDTVVMARRVVI